MINVRTTRIKNVHTQNHGGYIAYWKLIPQLYKQARELKKLVGTMMDTVEGSKKMTRAMFFAFKVKLWLKTPWWALIKPLGSLFHSVTRYEGDYSTWGDGAITDVNIRKEGVVFFLRFIPVWPIMGKLREVDLERIFKEEKDNVRLEESRRRSHSGTRGRNSSAFRRSSGSPISR